MFKRIAERMQQGDPNKKDLTSENMPKNKYELFFSMLGLHFGDIFKMNLLFALFILPAVLWTLYTVMALEAALRDSSVIAKYASVLDMVVNHVIYYFLIMAPLLALAGPPLAGMNYVVSRWTRDEHSWLWEDFKEGMKENWRQAALLMFLFGLVLGVGSQSIYMYGLIQGPTSMIRMMRIVLIFVVIAIVCVYLYVVPMLIRYDLSVRNILKNSVILGFAKLPFTILFNLIGLIPLVIGLWIYIFASNLYGMMGMLLYYGIFGMTFTCFLNNSLTNSVFSSLMDKRMAGGNK